MNQTSISIIKLAFHNRSDFMTATKGKSASTVAHAIAKLRVTPGVDWVGCSRGQMAESFASDDHGLDKLDLNDLKTAINL